MSGFDLERNCALALRLFISKIKVTISKYEYIYRLFYTRYDVSREENDKTEVSRSGR